MKTYELPAIPRKEIEAETEDGTRDLHLQAVKRATSISPIPATDT